MRIVFMGTPDAAVPTLERCVADGHEVVAVWTQPDRPAGRGGKLHEPPVKAWARAHNLPVHQPVKIKTDETAALFASYRADAAVVVAYGRILPLRLLATPERGCINVHFSLLPKYRGAAPVNWAIVRGESETGVTTMLMDEGLDTGATLLQERTEIGARETALELMMRLAHIGADVLSRTLGDLSGIEPRPQEHGAATHAPILRREDGRIGWSQSAVEIERAVRGFQPFPNAWTMHNERRLVVWQAEVCEVVSASGEEMNRNVVEARAVESGTIVEADGDKLVVACGGRTGLRVTEVQPEAKRRMSARDFLNGVRLTVGERFV